jgi:uncharacterized protein
VSNITEAREAILNSSLESSVYCGCDSIRYKKKGNWYAKYSTVIILHYDSRHGSKLFHETVEMLDYGSIRQRMMNEVMLAVQRAMEIIDIVGDRHFELHVDINQSPTHKSNVAFKEAAGYVRGTLGIEATFKPSGFAATHCADHLVKKH